MRRWTDWLCALEGHLKLVAARPGIHRPRERAAPPHLRPKRSVINLIDRACYLAITTGVETITSCLSWSA